MDAAVVYLVRVWCSDGRFRASVRAVDSESVALFGDAAALARYLGDAVRAAPPPAPATEDTP